MQAKLIPLNGGDPIWITRDVTVVGRKPGICDLLVDRGSVSKIHCLIVRTDGLLFIRDLGSTNGTKVNGQRITRGALLPGDELAFAGAKYRVFLGPDEQAGRVEPTEMLRPNEVDSHTVRRPMSSNSIEVAEGEHLPSADPPSDSDVRLLSDEELEAEERS